MTEMDRLRLLIKSARVYLENFEAEKLNRILAIAQDITEGKR